MDNLHGNLMIVSLKTIGYTPSCFIQVIIRRIHDLFFGEFILKKSYNKNIFFI